MNQQFSKGPAMSIDEIRQTNRAQPFKPFTVRVTDCDAPHGPHPDFLLIPPVGGTVIIVDQKGCMNLVDAAHITKL